MKFEVFVCDIGSKEPCGKRFYSRKEMRNHLKKDHMLKCERTPGGSRIGIARMRGEKGILEKFHKEFEEVD